VKAAGLTILLFTGLFGCLQGGYAEAVNRLSDEAEWIASVRNWDNSKPITEEINEQHIREADAFIGKGSVNPVVWYLRGSFGSARQYFYHKDLLNAGKKYRLDAPENQALIREYQSYYRKALDLDDRPDAPAHLTAETLGTMADDVLAAPDIKERALTKELALSRSGAYVSENENYEWETYEFLLGTYAAKKDYEAYLKTVNEMMERFPNSPRMNELLEYRRQAEAAIAKRDREAAKESGERK